MQAVLDGEIVSLDAKGKPVFRDLLRDAAICLRGAGPGLAGRADLRSSPLVERKRRLTELLPSDTGPLYKVFTLEEHGRPCSRRHDGWTSRASSPSGARPLRAGNAVVRIRNPAYRQGEPGSALPERRRTARRGAPSSALIS